MSARVRVGTAGWSLPRQVRDRFGAGDSNLARYATRFSCAEINSSFYRPHRPTTYARWAETTPPDFRFAVKVPKAITHEAKLVDCETLLDAFLAEAGGLGSRLGPLLVQLAPKHALDEEVASRFFVALRARHAGPVVLEPRHASWFTAAATDLLVMHRVARAAADPERFFVPPYVGHRGWLGVRLDRGLEWDEIAGIAEDACVTAAPFTEVIAVTPSAASFSAVCSRSALAAPIEPWR